MRAGMSSAAVCRRLWQMTRAFGVHKPRRGGVAATAVSSFLPKFMHGFQPSLAHTSHARLLWKRCREMYTTDSQREVEVVLRLVVFTLD